jgi:hypothetical protein
VNASTEATSRATSREAAVASGPGEEALDDPAPFVDLEADVIVALARDLGLDGCGKRDPVAGVPHPTFVVLCGAPEGRFERHSRCGGTGYRASAVRAAYFVYTQLQKSTLLQGIARGRFGILYLSEPTQQERRIYAS